MTDRRRCQWSEAEWLLKAVIGHWSMVIGKNRTPKADYDNEHDNDHERGSEHRSLVNGHWSLGKPNTGKDDYDSDNEKRLILVILRLDRRIQTGIPYAAGQRPGCPPARA